MDNEEEVLMVMRVNLAEMMALAAPEVYPKHVSVTPDGKEILYVKLCKALYGCLKSALLFYLKFWWNLHNNDFVINPYDPCVCEKNHQRQTHDYDLARGRSQDITRNRRGHH